MQYLLSQEEYDELTCKTGDLVKVNQKELQKLCVLVANHVPVDRDWCKEDKSPWGCIYYIDKNHNNYQGYCDECPSKNLCKSLKVYSK